MSVRDKSATPDLDTMLEALSNEYRRRVLIALLERESQDERGVRIPDDVIVAPETAEQDDRESVHIQMRHTHLPKLAEADLIEWERGMETVRAGPQFEAMRPLLQIVENHGAELAFPDR